METKKDQLVLLLTVLCSLAVLFLFNLITGPAVKERKDEGGIGILSSVMEGETEFERIETGNASLSVREVYRARSGRGYVVRCSLGSAITGNEYLVTIGILKNGDLSGMSVEDYDRGRWLVGEKVHRKVFLDESPLYEEAYHDALSCLESSGLLHDGETNGGTK